MEVSALSMTKNLSLIGPFLEECSVIAVEAAMAVAPILAIFLICDFTCIKLKMRKLGKVCSGLFVQLDRSHLVSNRRQRRISQRRKLYWTLLG